MTDTSIHEMKELVCRIFDGASSVSVLADWCDMVQDKHPEIEECCNCECGKRIESGTLEELPVFKRNGSAVDVETLIASYYAKLDSLGQNDAGSLQLNGEDFVADSKKNGIKISDPFWEDIEFMDGLESCDLKKFMLLYGGRTRWTMKAGQNGQCPLCLMPGRFGGESGACVDCESEAESLVGVGLRIRLKNRAYFCYKRAFVNSQKSEQDKPSETEISASYTLEVLPDGLGTEGCYFEKMNRKSIGAFMISCKEKNDNSKCIISPFCSICESCKDLTLKFIPSYIKTDEEVLTRIVKVMRGGTDQANSKEDLDNCKERISDHDSHVFNQVKIVVSQTALDQDGVSGAQNRDDVEGIYSNITHEGEQQLKGDDVEGIYSDISCDSKTELKTVKISEVCRFQGQPRKNFNKKKLAQLAESIKTVGQKVPVNVFRVNYHGYKYMLDDGERRWRAIQMIPQGMIDVRIIPAPKNNLAHYMSSFVTNFLKEKHTHLEIFHSIRLFHQEGITVKEMMSMFGKSDCTIYNYINLCKLDERLIKLLDDGIPKSKRLTFDQAVIISRAPAEKQMSIYETIVEMPNSLRLDKAKDMLSECIGKPRKRGNTTDQRRRLQNFIEKVIGQSDSFLSGQLSSAVMQSFKSQYSEGEMRHLLSAIKKSAREMLIFANMMSKDKDFT